MPGPSSKRAHSQAHTNHLRAIAHLGDERQAHEVVVAGKAGGGEQLGAGAAVPGGGERALVGGEPDGGVVLLRGDDSDALARLARRSQSHKSERRHEPQQLPQRPQRQQRPQHAATLAQALLHLRTATAQ